MFVYITMLKNNFLNIRKIILSDTKLKKNNLKYFNVKLNLLFHASNSNISVFLQLSISIKRMWEIMYELVIIVPLIFRSLKRWIDWTFSKVVLLFLMRFFPRHRSCRSVSSMTLYTWLYLWFESTSSMNIIH